MHTSRLHPAPQGAHRPEAASIVLVGGGGHALVVADIARALGVALSGFVDANPRAVLAQGQSAVRWLGDLSQPAWQSAGLSSGVLALGNLATRASVLPWLHDRMHAITLVHPRATVSPDATIGPGVVVGPGAIVNARAQIDVHAIINSGAIIEHECRVGCNSHVAPGAVLAGDVHIGPQTLVGVGARVLPGVRIGQCCVVGAGAVVTRDVADGHTVMGVPARVR